MKTPKLWKSFFLIFLYLVAVALTATAGGALFAGTPWQAPLISGGALWLFSLVFVGLGQKRKPFLLGAFAANALGAGLAISAYTVGKALLLSPTLLLALAVLLALSFLALVLLLSISSISMIIYTVFSYLVWLGVTIVCGIFLYPLLFKLLGIALPEQYTTYLIFFLIIVGLLAVGALIPTENFWGVAQNLIVPALAATFTVLLLALLCLGEGDGCDCSGGDNCCDCGGGSDKNTKRDTMSHLTEP